MVSLITERVHGHQSKVVGVKRSMVNIQEGLEKVDADRLQARELRKLEITRRACVHEMPLRLHKLSAFKSPWRLEINQMQSRYSDQAALTRPNAMETQRWMKAEQLHKPQAVDPRQAGQARVSFTKLSLLLNFDVLPLFFPLSRYPRYPKALLLLLIRFCPCA